MIAAYGDVYEIDIVDPKSGGKIITKLHGHEDYGYSLDWHQNGYLLATGN
jgi:hypothetical protein